MDNKFRIKNDYIILFDGVRVDDFVRSFETNHPKDGGMASASLRLGISFGRDLTKEQYENDYALARDNIIMMKRVFKEGTKVFIAMLNVVSGKYDFVFNGSIRSLLREGSKSKRFVSLSVSAVGSMSSANNLESILSLPRNTQILDNASVDAFKLKARGLDITNAQTMNTIKGLKMNEMTITQIVEKTREALVATNKLYRDTASTQNFEDIMKRIKILSDIDARLIKSELLDLATDVSVMKVETIYTTLAKALSRVMFEFYEMPYGDLMIKTPFWNTPILKDHIIPGILIADETDSLNFDQRRTRALVSGGLSQSFVGYAITEENFQFAVPMALYVEDLAGNGQWADVRNVNLTGTSASGGLGFSESDLDSLWKNVTGELTFKPKETGNPILDSMMAQGMMVSYNLTGYVKYIEYCNRGFEMMTYHIGWIGTVVGVLSNPLQVFGSEYAPKRAATDFASDKSTVIIRYEEGPYKGFHVCYGGITSVDKEAVKINETVKDGSRLGRVNRPVDGVNAANLYISVLYPDYASALKNEERAAFLSVSPIAVFRDFYTGKESATTMGVKISNINSLSNPVDAEFLYGMKYLEENQPIIRFLTTTNDSDVIEMTKRYTAFGLKSRNANISTLSITTAIPMPWIYPGFNVWIEPEGLDEVYYVNNVSHYATEGGPSGTRLYLTMGRDSKQFFTGNYDGNASNDFATLMSGGTFGENIFLSTDTGAKAFFASRDTIDSFSASSHYTSVKDKARKFKASGSKDYSIADDAFMKYLYGSNKKASSIGTSPSKMSGLNLSGEYSEEHITAVFKSLFTKGTKSDLIKVRHSDIARFMANLDPVKKI